MFFVVVNLFFCVEDLDDMKRLLTDGLRLKSFWDNGRRVDNLVGVDMLLEFFILLDVCGREFKVDE